MSSSERSDELHFEKLIQAGLRLVDRVPIPQNDEEYGPAWSRRKDVCESRDSMIRWSVTHNADILRMFKALLPEHWIAVFMANDELEKNDRWNKLPPLPGEAKQKHEMPPASFFQDITLLHLPAHRQAVVTTLRLCLERLSKVTCGRPAFHNGPASVTEPAPIKLQHADYLILEFLAKAQGPCKGAAIYRAIERSDSTFKKGCHRLKQLRLIETPKRKGYVITQEGRAAYESWLGRKV